MSATKVAEIFGLDGVHDTITIPVETNPKGLKTIVLDLDEFEMAETGTKEKEINGKLLPVGYIKFKVK